MGTALALAGVMLTAAAVYFAVEPQRLARRRGSIDRFDRSRRHLKRHVGRLFERSLAEQARFCLDQELPVLVRDGWIPCSPLPLESVLLQLRGASGAEDLMPGQRSGLR